MAPTDAKAPPTPTPTMSVPKPNPRNNPTMFKIFQNVQYNVVQHKKYLKEMMKLYKKLDEEVFRESFKNALLYLFTFGDTSAYVDRAVQFVATFCIALDDEDEFLLFIFEIIFQSQCVIGQSVRYRASQLLAAILSAMGPEASLDDDLCDKLLSYQMKRLQDTRGAVRCRAALALQRLQNPPDDEVTRAYRFHMSCDPSSSVRRAVLMSIAKIKSNVPYVLERLCDVDEAVRRAAFLYMAAMSVSHLKVTQRILTLKVGLTERSPRVRRVVEEILIPGWLSAFKGNIIDMLKAIRLDNQNNAKDSQYVAGKLLESLFKRLSISELLEWLPTDKNLHVIPPEKLNKETAWYWRHLAEHLQRIDDDETLETVLPALVVLTGYIRAIVESPCPSPTEDPVGFITRQDVLHELACMLRVYDATDPTGRDALKALITDVLTGDYGPLKPEVIRAFVQALEMVVPDVSQRIEIVYGMISSLRDPPEPELPPPPPTTRIVDDTKMKLERARLRVSLNVAIEAQEEAVREQNYALAAECKAKVEDIQKKLEELPQSHAPVLPPPPPVTTIKEKLSDAETLTKCLILLNCVLDTPQVNSITPLLKVIFDELEVELCQNPEIIEIALETFGLFGSIDKEFARENKAFFFANLIDTANEPIVTVVLKCLVDLLCVHGAKVFEDDDTTNNKSKNSTRHSVDVDADGTVCDSMISMTPNHSTVIDILLKIMDGPCASYRLIIVEGLCRLLYLGHLESPSILCRLLLLWFNPVTVDEDDLRQTIGVFFQTFPVSVDGAQDQLQKATLPILRALANAPSSSPLAEIDQEAVVKFIVSLTRVNNELTDSQGNMAMMLTNYLARKPTSDEAGLACRMLALLSPPRESRLAIELAHTLRDVCSKLPDKQSNRNLARYLGALETIERASLNKMSNTGITDGTMQNEDTMSHIGRATSSLPQPLARSTHMVINETVEEEVEIDETSPTEPMTKINEEVEVENAPKSPKTPENHRATSESDSAASAYPVAKSSGSCSDVSPVKKAKVTKKKKKLSITRTSSESDKATSNAKDKQDKQKKDNNDRGGIKRTRSQRSIEDVEIAITAKSTTKSKKSPPKEQKSPIEDLDVSNVTIRRSVKKPPAKPKKVTAKGKTQAVKSKPVTRASVSSRSSSGSLHSLFDDSADETELHTIIYDQEFQQEILNDSSELADSKLVSKGNVTIPETPEQSEESESEPEPAPAKTKGKQNGKKK